MLSDTPSEGVGLRHLWLGEVRFAAGVTARHEILERF